MSSDIEEINSNRNSPSPSPNNPNINDHTERDDNDTSPRDFNSVALEQEGIRNALFQTIQLMQTTANLENDNFGEEFPAYDLGQLSAGARDALLGVLRYNEEDDEDYVPDYEMDEDEDHDNASYFDDEDEDHVDDFDDDDDDIEDDGDDGDNGEGIDGPRGDILRRVNRELFNATVGFGGGGMRANRIIISGGNRFEQRRIRTPAEIASAHSELEQVPNKKMTELLSQGEFGYLQTRSKHFSSQYPQNTSKLLLMKKLGIRRPPHSEFAKRFLPNNPGRLVKRYLEPAYGGQFSADGSLFYCYTQEFKVHVYDTKDPARPVLLRSLETAMGENLPITSRWTITDADITKDNRFLVHSTRSPVLTLSTNINTISVNDDNNKVETIPLVVKWEDIHDRERTVIFSARFSSDGTHIITGNSKPDVTVFDIEHQSSESIGQQHTEDINAVRFLDNSDNVIISGSDDATIRLWDRRSRESGRKCVGILPGHIEGITCVETKGDGRYIISNGKDQTMKLWDIRKMGKWNHSKMKYVGTGYKYQFEHYRSSRLPRHPFDASIMTFRGHEVVRTAIRCHFSPPSNTDQQYVYSGSSDGNVYIWKLDGTLIRKLEGALVSRNHAFYTDHYNINRSDIMATTQGSLGGFRITCVRDCSWHPSQPFLYAPAWTEPSNLEGGAGSLLIYSYNHESDPQTFSKGEGEFEYLRSSIDEPLAAINRLHSRRIENTENVGGMPMFEKHQGRYPPYGPYYPDSRGASRTSRE